MNVADHGAIWKCLTLEETCAACMLMRIMADTRTKSMVCHGNLQGQRGKYIIYFSDAWWTDKDRRLTRAVLASGDSWRTETSIGPPSQGTETCSGGRHCSLYSSKTLSAGQWRTVTS